MGRLHKAVRVIWPRFRVHTMLDLQLSGVPPRDPGVKLSKHFSSSAWHANWKNGKHLCSTIRRLPINKIVCCMSSWMTCVNVLWRKATRPSHAHKKDTDTSVSSGGRDRILPLLDQIFERYGRLRTGECTSASLELISWFA